MLLVGRGGHYTCAKTKEWSDSIGLELKSAVILQKTVYNMDETGALLTSLESLINKDDFSRYRRAAVQRTLTVAASTPSLFGQLP